MIIVGIDPGQKESGVVKWSHTQQRVLERQIMPNQQVISYVQAVHSVNIIAIEHFRGYGLRVGNDTFDSIWWSGRFAQIAVSSIMGIQVRMIPRADIVDCLCGHPKAGDKAVHQALVDKYGEVGTKKNPGPLYGIKSHLWAALAVAVVAGKTNLGEVVKN